MKKKEIKETSPETVSAPAEVKPAEVTSPEVRLETIEVKPDIPAPAEPQVVKPSELGASIDNLAKIVDSSSGLPQTPATAEKPTKTESKQGYLWLAISFFLGLGMGIGVGYLIWGRTPLTDSSGTPVVNVSPTVIPLASPTAAPALVTPTPGNLKKSSLVIEVLNGNGGVGVAAKAKELLTAAGYTNVTATNADREDYTQTEISIKASKNAYLAGLKKDLSGQYTIAEKVTTLAENNTFDAIVIIGQK